MFQQREICWRIQSISLMVSGWSERFCSGCGAGGVGSLAGAAAVCGWSFSFSTFFSSEASGSAGAAAACGSGRPACT